MKKFFLLLVSFIPLFEIKATELDITTRPEGLQRRIETSFLRVSSNKEYWCKNGAEDYHILGDTCPDKDILKYIVENHKDSTDINILDLGAGECFWGRSMAQYIGEEFLNHPQKPKVNFFSLTGETYQDMPISETFGPCATYNFTGFNIQTMLENLRKLNINLENKVNFIISRWTLIHLEDPVGTFYQAAQLLKDGGFMATDGMPAYIRYPGESQYFFPKDNPVEAIVRFLKLTNLSFAVYTHRARDDARQETHDFVIQKRMRLGVVFPLEYANGSANKVNGASEGTQAILNALTERQSQRKLFTWKKYYRGHLDVLSLIADILDEDIMENLEEMDF